MRRRTGDGFILLSSVRIAPGISLARFTELRSLSDTSIRCVMNVLQLDRDVENAEASFPASSAPSPASLTSTSSMTEPAHFLLFFLCSLVTAFWVVAAMRPSALLALPASLLLYIADARDLDRPRDILIDDALSHNNVVEKDIESQPKKLAWPTPVGVRKMSEDEGEKFYLHYWNFAETDFRNTSNVATAPIAPYINHDRGLSSLGHRLFARDFQCPANTQSCSSIGSDLCCPSGKTCVSTSDGVGCCAFGDDCDAVDACDAAAGYTNCPNSSTGGCCVPGSACVEGSGCVVYGTSTVILTLSPSTVTAGMTTVTGGSGTTTYFVPQSTVSGYTTTVTTTETVALVVSGQVSTVTQPTTVVIIGSLPTISTSSETSWHASTSDNSISVALQLTSTTTTITVSPSSDASCPVGFYMCSAYYLGNCCRVGRNCDTSSCPSSDSTTILSSSVATVVVPATTDADAAATQGSCANGWDLCDANAGGGCCPSGYVCGSSCTATADGQSNTAKEAPSGASMIHAAWSFMILGLVTGIGMVML
nr:hypothetical protein CFP56_43908 [Quercus suber]